MLIVNAEILTVVLGKKNGRINRRAKCQDGKRNQKTKMAAVNSRKSGKSGKKIPPLKNYFSLFSLNEVFTLHDHYALSE